jgi:hypothetical protein
VALHEVEQFVEVFPAEPLQLLDLVGKMTHAVGVPVGEAGLAEAAVAPAGAVAHHLLLEHTDIQPRIALLESDGGPQAGEATAYHRDVSSHPAFEQLGRVVVILTEPEARSPVTLPILTRHRAPL